MHRFDKLPLHKFCCSSYPTYAVQPVDHVSSEEFYQYVNPLPAHGINQDCLGMTPLHILACRGHSVEIFQYMIEKYPNALLIKDHWGDIPLIYSLYAEASTKVIHFLFETHRLRWGTLPFDFSHAIETLAAKIESAEYVRDVILAQRVHFPSLAIDWQGIVHRFVGPYINVFRELIEASVSSRSFCNCPNAI